MEAWTRTGISRLILGVVLVLVGLLVLGNVGGILVVLGIVGIIWGLLGVLVGVNRRAD